MLTGYKVCDAMTRKPISVTPNATIQECAKLMKENDVGSLVIRDNNDKLKGLITEQMLVHKIIVENRDFKKTKASEIMEEDMKTIEPNMDIYEAMVKMRDMNTRQAPVVTKEGKLVGLLTIKDILKIEPSLFELIAETMQIREEENKPIIKHESEGICELCGNYEKKLIEKEGIYMCDNCFTL